MSGDFAHCLFMSAKAATVLTTAIRIGAFECGVVAHIVRVQGFADMRRAVCRLYSKSGSSAISSG